MTESTWTCSCGKENAASSTACVLCQTPHDPARIDDSHPTGSISRAIGLIVGLAVLPMTIWLGLIVGGGSTSAGVFVILLVLSLGFVTKFYFANEPSVRRALDWMFPYKWV